MLPYQKNIFLTSEIISVGVKFTVTTPNIVAPDIKQITIVFFLLSFLFLLSSQYIWKQKVKVGIEQT